MCSLEHLSLPLATMQTSQCDLLDGFPTVSITSFVADSPPSSQSVKEWLMYKEIVSESTKKYCIRLDCWLPSFPNTTLDPLCVRMYLHFLETKLWHEIKELARKFRKWRQIGVAITRTSTDLISMFLLKMKKNEVLKY